jgi:hypothetical protein
MVHTFMNYLDQNLDLDRELDLDMDNYFRAPSPYYTVRNLQYDLQQTSLLFFFHLLSR